MNVRSFASTLRIRLLVVQDKLQPYSFSIQIYRRQKGCLGHKVGDALSYNRREHS